MFTKYRLRTKHADVGRAVGESRIWNGRQIPSARALGALLALWQAAAAAALLSLSVSSLSPISSTSTPKRSSLPPHLQRELSGGRSHREN